MPAAASTVAGNRDYAARTAFADDALCGCADDGCAVDWIDDTLGCGVCAHFTCDGVDFRGACVPCDDAGPGQGACIFVDDPGAATE